MRSKPSPEPEPALDPSSQTAVMPTAEPAAKPAAKPAAETESPSLPVLIVKSPPKPASVFDPADKMALGSKSPSKPAPHKQVEQNNWLDGDKRKVPRLQRHNSILHQGRSVVAGMPEAPRGAGNADLGRAGTQSPPRVLNMINSNAQGGEEDKRSLSSEGSGNFYVSKV